MIVKKKKISSYVKQHYGETYKTPSMLFFLDDKQQCIIPLLVFIEKYKLNHSSSTPQIFNQDTFMKTLCRFSPYRKSFELWLEGYDNDFYWVDHNFLQIYHRIQQVYQKPGRVFLCLKDSSLLDKFSSCLRIHSRPHPFRPGVYIVYVDQKFPSKNIVQKKVKRRKK